MLSHKFKQLMSTPHYFSLQLILLVTHIYHIYLDGEMNQLVTSFFIGGDIPVGTGVVCLFHGCGPIYTTFEVKKNVLNTRKFPQLAKIVRGQSFPRNRPKNAAGKIWEDDHHMIQRNWGGDLHQLLICKHWG